MAWLFTYGKIPKHLDVCHTCDNRLCCRPEHLWLGTHKQNMADQKAKMRHIYGERNHKAKLTEAKAIAILRNPPRMGRGGVSQVEEYAKRRRHRRSDLFARSSQELEAHSDFRHKGQVVTPEYLEQRAQELFKKNAEGWRAPPWQELHDDTRQLWREFAAKRIMADCLEILQHHSSGDGQK